MAPEAFRAEPGRLDAVVAAALGVPRADVQRAIAAGGILVDGVPRPKSHRLQGGERLLVELPADPTIAPEGPTVPVRYRDDDVLVVAKPAGLVTHPTPSRTTGTLVNRLLGMGVPLAPAGGSLRPGIVHRLDAGTSGLLVVASTDRAYEVLRTAFARHDVERRYLALVRGAPEHDRFTVDAPLGRRAARIAVDRVGGRAAVTTFAVVERFPATTLVEAIPQTGRTHQIRVHAAAIGHPIVGDRSYGGGGDAARALTLRRPFLHAARLGFVHPVTGAWVEVEEPLPEDLAEALRRARADLRP
ncbi:MAG TPA: RluA family pseudouridine synthase [Actinomycetota bacterium]|nr:RluA family pseudouridine synthase [Actinomycetota bacterium]